MKLRSLIYQSVFWRGIYFGSVLLLNIMIARYFEASHSGLIYFVTNSFALIVAISSFSMESGVAYYSASGEVPILRLANFSLWWTLIATTVVFVVLKVAGYFELIPESYNQLFFPAVCYVAGCLLVNFYMAAFYSRKNFRLPNIVLICVNLVLAILVPFSTGMLFSIQTYVDIYFLGFLLQGLLITFFFYIRYAKPSLFQLPSRAAFSKLAKYSMTAFLANVLFFLVYRIDYWFVEYYCTSDALGNYIQVSKLTQTLFILPSMIASAVFPAIVSSAESRISEKVATIARVLLLIYLSICLLLAATGYWLFPFVFGKTFGDMYAAFLLLIPGILVLVMMFPVTAYYAGVKKIRLNVIALFFSLIFIIMGNLMLTPQYGINGAALASTVGYIVYHVFLVFFFLRENTLSYLRFYRIKKSDFSQVKKMITEKRSLSYEGK